MANEPERSDSRVNAARYQVGRLTDETSEAADPGRSREPEDPVGAAGQSMMDQRAQFVETTIEQAIRRGEFDNLPGSGKPLANLRQTHDPDWWIRQKIERERLTGLGPPALTLRTENTQLDARIAAATTEHAIRELLEDFNARVISARRQLQGGPPVVTPTRDIDVEIAKWREQRALRQSRRAEESEREEAQRASMTWKQRRRLRREERARTT